MSVLRVVREAVAVLVAAVADLIGTVIGIDFLLGVDTTGFGGKLRKTNALENKLSGFDLYKTAYFAQLFDQTPFID